MLTLLSDFFGIGAVFVHVSMLVTFTVSCACSFVFELFSRVRMVQTGEIVTSLNRLYTVKEHSSIVPSSLFNLLSLGSYRPGELPVCKWIQNDTISAKQQCFMHIQMDLRRSNRDTGILTDSHLLLITDTWKTAVRRRHCFNTSSCLVPDWDMAFYLAFAYFPWPWLVVFIKGHVTEPFFIFRSVQV